MLRLSSLELMRFPSKHAVLFLLVLPLCAQTFQSLADAGVMNLAAKHYAAGQGACRGGAKAHPESVDAEVGVGDAELALREYENAELTYRSVVLKEPQMWRAHKNLVIIEARLGRWDEFDREGAVLRAGQEREAEGISARESDVINSFRRPRPGTGLNCERTLPCLVVAR